MLSTSNQRLVRYNSFVQLTSVDWLVVALYFLFNLAIGFYYKSRAGKNVNEFFLSGRNVPWWLAGTSMVATTFAADTPLAVTGMVAMGGIAGNWLWWNFIASGMLTVFFYARLWRRSGVMTDIEFSEIRYSGKPAAFLRGFRALYLGIPINCIILGWVNLAMVKILQLVLGVTKPQALAIVIGMIALTSFISTLSGLWGVLVTDLFQFVIKMGMVTVLAVFAVRAVGGIDGMKVKLAPGAITRAAAAQGSVLNFVPDLHSAWMPMITFLVYISMNWWSTWYPGAEPGGGGYIAQRMFSAKDEKNSLLATLWFNIAHYAVRPWPWILVALASLILFPGLADPETGYIRVMIAYLPPSLRGLMIAAFAAAYMSTIATQLNWGASYLVNDFYRRFFEEDRNRAPLRHRLAMGDRASHHRLGRRDVLSGLHRRRLETAAGHRRGHRRRLVAALVLVAHQRLERSLGHDLGLRRLARDANRLRPRQRSAARLRLDHDRHRFRHHRASGWP